MKSNIRWTIIFVAMMVMAMFLIENKDIEQMCIFIGFWLSIACQYLENIKIELVKQNMEEEDDELQDSEGREDSEGLY